jgi:transcription elongation GreA/GreB family factor
MAEQQAEKVTLGTLVRLAGFEAGEDELYHIVPEGQADYLDNKIPRDNPLARA